MSLRYTTKTILKRRERRGHRIKEAKQEAAEEVITIEL